MKTLRLFALLFAILLLVGASPLARAEEPKPPVSVPEAGRKLVASELRAKLPADCLLIVEAPSMRRFCSALADSANQFVPAAILGGKKIDWNTIYTSLGEGLTESRSVPNNLFDLASPRGAMGLALFDPNKHEEPVILFQIRDKEKFLKKTVGAGRGEKPGADHVGWFAPRRNRTYHFTLQHDTVILSRDAKLIKRIAKNAAAGAQRTEMPRSGQDGLVIVSGNLKAVNTLYGKQIQGLLAMLKMMLQMKPDEDGHQAGPVGEIPPEFIKMLPGLIDSVAKGIDAFLTSSDNGTLALSLDAKGMTLNFEYAANPGSPIAKSLASLKNPTMSAIRFLPANTVAVDLINVGSGLSDLYQPVIKLLAADKKYKPLADTIGKLVSYYEGQYLSALVAPPKGGKGIGTIVLISEAKQPEKALAEYDALMKTLAGQLNAIDMPNPVKSTYTARKKAGVHHGVTYWKSASKSTIGDLKMPGVRGKDVKMITTFLEKFNSWFGGDIYSAGFNGHMVIAYGSNGEATLKNLLDTMRNKKDGALVTSAAYKEAFRSSTDGAFFVEYANIAKATSLLAAEVNGMKGLDFPKEANIVLNVLSNAGKGKPNGIGFMLKATDTTLTGEMHLSDKLISELVEVGGGVFIGLAMAEGDEEE